MAKKKKKRFRNKLTGWIFRFTAKLLLIIVFITLLQVTLLRFIAPPFTVQIAYEFLRNKLSSRHYITPRHEWRTLTEISPRLVQAVLAGEDQRFMTHHGFDFVEMNNAFREIISDKRIRGASTITMQVSRSLFLWPGRSLLRKLLEAYYTVLVELILTKTRILEIYLNVVDWGPGIMGAEAASMYYFNTSAANVTALQAARLAAILPSPHRWSPTNPNQQVIIRQERILKDMQKMHL